MEKRLRQAKLIKTIYIPIPLFARAEAVAKSRFSSFSALVIEALQLYLELLESGELERMREHLKKTVEVVSGG